MTQRLGSFFEIKREIQIAIGIVIAAFFLTLVSVIWLFNPRSYQSELNLEKPAPIKRESAHYRHFSFGPLSLDRNESDIPIPDIQKHIVLLSQNDRFDVSDQKRLYKIGIRGSNTKIVEEKERVYLGFAEGHQDRVKFDDLPSPIWIRLFDRDGETTLEVGLDVIDEEGEKVVQNRRHYPIPLSQEWLNDEQLDPSLLAFCQALQRCECYIPDQLYEVYSDPSDSKYGKYRLEIPHQKAKDVIFVEHATPLFFTNDEIGKEEGVGPVAQVTKIDDDFLHLCAWNQNGLQKRIVKFALNKGVPVDFRVEDVIKRLRKRTANSVSCLLGNKSTQLKRGDWAIHTKMGWKVIKSQSDFIDVVNLKVVGELFVFDEMVKREGQYEMLGHLFDQSRSQVLDVALPFVEAKKKGSSTHISDEDEDMFGTDEDFFDDDESFEYFDFDF